MQPNKIVPELEIQAPHAINDSGEEVTKVSSMKYGVGSFDNLAPNKQIVSHSDD